MIANFVLAVLTGFIAVVVVEILVTMYEQNKETEHEEDDDRPLDNGDSK